MASLAAAALLAGADAAFATTDTTFGDPLDTVKGIVGGTGGQLSTTECPIPARFSTSLGNGARLRAR